MPSSFDHNQLSQILSLGEGQGIEFKESPSKLDREIVAFANANGGVIYCGISDKSEVIGTDVSNRTISQIQDIARNCDPPIAIKISSYNKKLLLITIPEGSEKPYQCSSRVFLRIGASSQKLKIGEIKELLSKNISSFDSRINSAFLSIAAVSKNAFENYCQITNIPKQTKKEPLLENLLTARRENNKYYLTNSGVLLFTDSPRRVIPESYTSAVLYAGTDRFKINDRQEFSGDLISQIEGAISFVKRNIKVGYEVTGAGRRIELPQYPLAAIREALINAVVHRDYNFQNSCIYLSIYSDRLEIENPGGIFSGVLPEEIEGRSLRRNPILADLLFRAGYGEKLGSGITRIKQELKQNNNPEPEVVSTNFFSIRFYPRIEKEGVDTLTQRQLEIVRILNSTNIRLSSAQLADELGVSPTTVAREIKKLVEKKFIIKIGVGRGVRYSRELKDRA